MGNAPTSGRRVTAAAEGDVVVFLIGMRINRWRAVRHWLPALTAMPRMLKELTQDSDSGLLGHRSLSGGPRVFTVAQYWESREKLLAYASDQAGSIAPRGRRSTAVCAAARAAWGSGTRRTSSRRVRTSRSTSTCRRPVWPRHGESSPWNDAGSERRSGWRAGRLEGPGAEPEPGARRPASGIGSGPGPSAGPTCPVGPARVGSVRISPVQGGSRSATGRSVRSRGAAAARSSSCCGTDHGRGRRVHERGSWHVVPGDNPGSVPATDTSPGGRWRG